MPRFRPGRLALATVSLIAACCLAPAAAAQQVNPEIYTLDNGMTFLLLPRDEEPNIIAAGWVAKVGSANERPGITGMSHFFEHMMFKGTTTVGTRDPAADERYRTLQKQARDRMLDIVYSDQYDRWRSGQIADPWDPAADTPELREARAELQELMDQHREEIVKNEFDRIYTDLGASGMNAFTTSDLTFYFISVPSNKLELWAWMESDRLYDSVFREFYAERDVVHEERRLRTESTPTGIFQEQFDSMFWISSPYQWPVIGWPSDLNSYTKEQAEDFYRTYYGANNLVGVIVGDFDPSEAKRLIDRYFSRLEPSNQEPPPVVTLEVGQMAEMRMIAECDCQPQVEVRYHTVPFGHADEAPLQMLAAVLNGRTGRLYRSMVEGREIASSASAFQSSSILGAPAKHGGYFAFSATTKGGSDPTDLEEAWYAELERLQNELVPERELQKVKNQAAADSYRRLQNNFFLLVQLGYYEGLGGWEYINESPRRQQEVTPEDIQRVANEYFSETNRAVALYYREEGAAPEDPALLEALQSVPAEMRETVRAQIKQQLNALQGQPLEALVQIRNQMRGQASEVPEAFKGMFDYMLTKIDERIEQLESAGDE